MSGSLEDQHFQVLLVGAPKSGKTALGIKLFSDSFFVDYEPIVEDTSVRKLLDVDGAIASLRLEEISDYKSEYYTSWIRPSNGFLLVYSVSSRSSFEELENWRSKILSMKEATEKVPMVLVGSRCDEDHVVSTEEAQEYADKNEMPFIETSPKAKINDNVCFYEIVREIRKSRSKELHGGNKCEIS
eukprot:TRINITY_DN22194_c0_g1_i1.p1 TRINITY_DN22194_c0_g1~~TRINITY_DN22194_c0_g1_i1.p1  ORF type:complete len:186 (+),score=51.12 TRINITY_DN22194_c0_g1_i1:21-578(+)